ncbi:MAG: hypothetical protein KF784_02260 [Fimbriimonadaceae bacterium]|nr:hypothetical protein [Fimbriimonadaceae bacterium]
MKNRPLVLVMYKQWKTFRKNKLPTSSKKMPKCVNYYADDEPHPINRYPKLPPPRSKAEIIKDIFTNYEIRGWFLLMYIPYRFRRLMYPNRDKKIFRFLWKLGLRQQAYYFYLCTASGGYSLVFEEEWSDDNIFLSKL